MKADTRMVRMLVVAPMDDELWRHAIARANQAELRLAKFTLERMLAENAKDLRKAEADLAKQ